MAKIVFAALALFASAGLTHARDEVPATHQQAEIHHGVATFYGRKFEGRRTANGETFRHADLTAAHATLPFGTVARVTNPSTGKSVIVRITDRLPHKRALVDLTHSAASKLQMLRAGRARVTLQVLDSIDAVVQEPKTH